MKILRHFLLFPLLAISAVSMPTLTQKATDFISNSDGMQFGKIHLSEPLPREIFQDSLLSRTEKIKQLQEFTENSQREAISILKALEASGDVERIRPIWIVNVVGFKGNARAFQYLANSDLDAIIDLDQPQNVLLDDFDLSFDFDSVAWGIRQMNVEEVWRRFGLTGRGVNLAIFDTGVQPTHPDLVGQFWINEDEIPFTGRDDDGNGYIDDYHGYNFVDGEGGVIPWDDRGHGTHVAATMVGNGSYGQMTGMAPGAKLVNLKTINSSGRGILADSWEAVGYAIVTNVPIANLSIGWRNAEILDRATWRNAVINARSLGLLLVVAAGNEGGDDTSCDDLRTPGDVPEALTVGATGISRFRVPISAAGPVGWGDVSPWFDCPCPPGCIKPDIMAPGDRVASASLFYTYERKTGTSMAAPHVAGACALLLQADPTLTPDDLILVLTETAIDGGVTGPDNYYGHGTLDIVTAVEEVLGELGYIKVYTRPFARAYFTPGDLYAIADYSGIFVLAFSEGSTKDFIIKSEGYVDYTGSCTFTTDTTAVLAIMTEKAHANQAIIVRSFETDDYIDSAIVTTQYGGRAYTNSEGRCSVMAFVGDSMTVKVSKPGFVTREIDILGATGRKRHIFLHKAEDFEDETHGFTGTGDWEYGIPSYLSGPEARSGEKLFGTVLDDDYSNSSNSLLQSPPIYLDCENPMLYFYSWLDSEATSWGIWDAGNVKVSTDGGELFDVIFPAKGSYDGHIDDYNEIMPWEPAYAGSLFHAWWDQKEFDLSQYTGDTVIIGFHFSSDDNTRHPGWYIDDFAVVQHDSRPPTIFDVLTVLDDDALNNGLKAIGFNCDISLDGVYIHYSLDGGLSFDSSLCFLEADSDSFYCRLDSLPSLFDMQYYFTARDECGRIARFPAEDYLYDSFGIDTIPPLIDIVHYRDKTISRHDFKISAIIFDSLSGVDAASIFLNYAIDGLSDTVRISYTEMSYDTFVFYIADTLYSGQFIDFYIDASDIATTPNYSRSEVFRLNITDIARFDFEDDRILFAYPDTIWQWGIFEDSHCWIAGDGYSIPPGIAILTLIDLSLIGLENAYMTFDIISNLPENAGFDIRSGLDIPEPLSGYTTFVPLLGGLGLGGHLPEWTTHTVILDDYIGQRRTIDFRFASDGVSGSFAFDNLTLYAFEEAITEDFNNIPDNLMLEVFPNPANSRFAIMSNLIVRIEIYDIKGRLVYQLDKPDSNIHWQPSDEHKTAVYLIKGHGKDGEVIKKKALFIK